MSESIKIGQVWKDNDTRMRGRLLVVESVGERYIWCRNKIAVERKTRIARKFFRPSGREYSTGFSLATMTLGTQEPQ